MGPDLCVVRGGGDIATGIVWRLTRAGWPVVVTELADPLTVRRTVAVSSAVQDGSVVIEGMRAERVDTIGDARRVAGDGTVAVMVEPGLPTQDADVVIDARLAKRNIDTARTDAPLVIGIGPGFTAEVDCHAVVETNRGHHLGRVFWVGSAAVNTGVPGEIGGRSAERVLRSPAPGSVEWQVEIGDDAREGEVLGVVGSAEITAPFTGIVRGLIGPGVVVGAGTKVGDIDPRCGAAACYEISDKALSVGGGVVEAVLTWLNR